MSDAAVPIISLDDQVKAVRREINMRKRCYPRWVARGTMKQAEADHQLAAMQAVLETLEEGDNRRVDQIKAYFERQIGVAMEQAEHWLAEGVPGAVHHRLMKADECFQSVVLFDRSRVELGWPRPFDQIDETLSRPHIKPLGAYPYSKEMAAFRDCRHVVAALDAAASPVESPPGDPRALTSIHKRPARSPRRSA